MRKVKFNYADIRTIPLSNKNDVKTFVEQLFVLEKTVLSHINYIFCSDSYLLQINQQYLSHDFLTDIITFDLSEGEGVIGEVYISHDRVQENALQGSVSYGVEMLRVIFHGALHLCGYKDKTKSEITFMRQKEDFYLQLFLKT